MIASRACGSKAATRLSIRGRIPARPEDPRVNDRRGGVPSADAGSGFTAAGRLLDYLCVLRISVALLFARAKAGLATEGTEVTEEEGGSGRLSLCCAWDAAGGLGTITVLFRLDANGVASPSPGLPRSGYPGSTSAARARP
jgi:hypothetical protein